MKLAQKARSESLLKKLAQKACSRSVENMIVPTMANPQTREQIVVQLHTGTRRQLDIQDVYHVSRNNPVCHTLKRTAQTKNITCHDYDWF